MLEIETKNRDGDQEKISYRSTEVVSLAVCSSARRFWVFVNLGLKSTVAYAFFENHVFLRFPFFDNKLRLSLILVSETPTHKNLYCNSSIGLQSAIDCNPSQ